MVIRMIQRTASRATRTNIASRTAPPIMKIVLNSMVVRVSRPSEIADGFLLPLSQLTAVLYNLLVRLS